MFIVAINAIITNVGTFRNGLRKQTIIDMALPIMPNEHKTIEHIPIALLNVSKY